MKAKQRWAVDIPERMSPSGKRQRKFFPSRDKAREFCGDSKEENAEHGKTSVTAQERQWVTFLRRELGNINLVPEVVRHWKRTAGEAITKTSVKTAVDAFTKARLPGVGKRTESDIKWRLNALAAYFDGRSMHEIAAGDLEKLSRQV